MRPREVYFLKKSALEDMLIDFRHIEGREKGKETSMSERNIHQLPLVLTLTEDQTHSLGM